MAFPIAAVPILGGLLDKILDKVAKDKVDDATMEELRQSAQKMLMDEGQEELNQFYDFILDYEGRASDHGKFIQWLRGTVRPILTYAFTGCLFYIIYMWMMGDVHPSANMDLVVKLIFALNGLTLGFWFGERALKNLNLDQFFKMRGQ